jgi:hypothetical protein
MKTGRNIVLSDFQSSLRDYLQIYRGQVKLMPPGWRLRLLLLRG